MRNGWQLQGPVPNPDRGEDFRRRIIIRRVCSVSFWPNMINSAVSGLTRERMIFMFISISMEQTNTNTIDRAKAGEPDVSWTPCRLRMTVKKKKRKRMDHIHINCFCHCHWCSRLVRCTFFSIFVLCDNRSKTERRSSLKKSESSSSCCNNENPSQPVCKVAHLHSQNGKSFTAGSSAGPTP